MSEERSVVQTVDNLLHLRRSRRGLGIFVVRLAVGAAIMKTAGETIGLAAEMKDIENTWSRAAVSNEEFFQNYQDKLQKVTLGASFAPEEFSSQERDKSLAMEALRITIEELGIRDVRLGIRWNKVIGESGEFDFGFYKPYLDYCLEKDVNVCLNIGPIKTFRWKEEHVPGYILAKLPSVPQKRSVIRKDDVLAQYALEYTRQLLTHITSSYSQHQLLKITKIQPENEGLFPFGENEWTMGTEYIKKLIRTIERYFPHAKILLNSAGKKNLREITRIFNEMKLEDPQKFNGRFISGFNYHYKTPKPEFPAYLNTVTDFIYEKLDPISAPGMHKTCEQNLEDAKRFGFRIQVTEGQAEPYPPHYTPGNDATGFRFMLLRCMERILNLDQHQSLISIWGIEGLVKKIISDALDNEHMQIIEIIKTVNRMMPEQELAQA
ncbi:hypothetical protein A2870_03850 [Candidatus Curtissbacteria bacterium RIFCSPHIGHO2_01_FULL_41_11]|uniref:Glycoside hydrolase family 42 N-terminal domain-containing protein n=1 Tax=Candidatus Curtissbacteria bacterium RIFCSPHIGHO2_01_FULL_41_11 TaxID=1797711 RepID=A0A1F5G6J8_9BACT|nr:MAG: hypothetical protein A2870_03850 [Candidatus Curtissbacteria bacterium RIFCSPHIGHO2_01_FULL_41_11]